MKLIKNLVKKYFSSFAFFYSYLRNKIFIGFGLSIAVSFLDGLGLSMFFPLLQVVGGDNLAMDDGKMGNLSYLVDGIQNMGIPLNLLSVLVIMVVFFIFKGFFSYLSSIYRIILQQTFIRKIRLDLLHSLNEMSFKKFILSDAGQIQNTMSGEVASVSNGFYSYFNAFQQAVMLVVYVGFAFFLDPKFSLIICAGGILTQFLYNIIYKHTEGASIKLTNHNNIFQGEIIQHVSNFKYLKATGRVHQYSERLQNTISFIENFRRRMGFLASISTAAREPLLIIIIAAVIFIQVKFLNGNMGAMLISLLFFFRALTSMMMLQQFWNNFIQVSGSMKNMHEFQTLLSTNKEKNGKIKVVKFEEKISFKNVSFFYDNTPILKDINLEILKNDSVGFVGESGSGKTTIINLIAGLIPEGKGEIQIDGVPMKSIKKETYQSRIGYVSQDSVVFNDSIFNNITFWAEKTPENIERFKRCIEQASLTTFLRELEKGEETYLGNNGLNLSGGQKQRISIARELFKDIDILILDEATSALDSETEKAIQESIDSLHGKYTLIIVAHRLSTIRNTDKVVMMDKGKIIAIDTFSNLLATEDRFRRMVELQEI